MKKLVAALLCGALVLSLCACNKSDNASKDKSEVSEIVYFDGKSSVKVDGSAALDGLEKGEIPLQVEEDGDYVTVSLGMTAEQFLPLFGSGEEMQKLERKGFAEYLPVGGQIFVGLETPSEGAVAIAQYGEVFQFTPTVTTKDQIKSIMGQADFEGDYSQVSSENLIYGSSDADCLMYKNGDNQLWFMFTSGGVFQSTVMCKAGKFIFNI